MFYSKRLFFLLLTLFFGCHELGLASTMLQKWSDFLANTEITQGLGAKMSYFGVFSCPFPFLFLAPFTIASFTLDIVSDNL